MDRPSPHYTPVSTGQDLYGLITVCGLESTHIYKCGACQYAGNSFATMEEHVADAYTREKLARVGAGIADPGPGHRR